MFKTEPNVVIVGEEVVAKIIKGAKTAREQQKQNSDNYKQRRGLLGTFATLVWAVVAAGLG